MKNTIAILLIVILTTVFGSTINAQYNNPNFTTGKVTGIIKEVLNNVALNNATINIVHLDGSPVCTINTNKNGEFNFNNLPVGDYQIIVLYGENTRYMSEVFSIFNNNTQVNLGIINIEQPLF